MKKTLPALLLMGALCVPCLADTALPPGGTALVSAQAFRDASFWSQPGVAAREWINDGGPDQTGAWRITISNNPGEFWGSEMQMTNGSAVAGGGVVLVRFFGRALGAEENPGAWCHLYAQYPPPSGNYEKDLLTPVTMTGSAWEEFFLPFELSRAAATGQLQLNFGLGADPAQFEIAGFEAIYWADGVAVEDLPRSRIRYPWMLPDAPWRAEAASRIEQHRKADLQVRVVDEAGQPVAGAQVDIRQMTHAFPFGTALAFWRLLDPAPENETYRRTFLELFNAAGNENALKAPAWQGDWGTWGFGREVALNGLRWLRDQRIPVRGHVLVWPGRDNLPASVRDLLDTPDQPLIPGLVLDHIEDITQATAGLVDEWDVINEPYSNHDLMDRFGNDIMADWFRAAAQHAPAGTPLFVNDYGILSGGGNPAKETYHLDLLDSWLADGVPVHGFGFQGHFDALLTDPARIYQILDRFAARGVALRITEFDIDSADLELQADYLRDFYTIVFSHPAVTGIQMWGFWANAHWKPQAALFAPDWSPRPAAHAYRALVWDEWFTRATAASDVDGRARIRGFLGDYEIVIHLPGRRVATRVSLPSEGGEIEIRIPPDKVPPPAGRLNIAPQGNGMAVDWQAEPHAAYRLESSSDLSRWWPHSSMLQDASGLIHYLIPLPQPGSTEPSPQFLRLAISEP